MLGSWFGLLFWVCGWLWWVYAVGMCDSATCGVALRWWFCDLLYVLVGGVLLVVSDCGDLLCALRLMAGLFVRLLSVRFAGSVYLVMFGVSGLT